MTLPKASETFTAGATGTLPPMVAFWLSPSIIVITVAGPMTAVAVNATGEAIPCTAALKLLGPMVVPSTHCVTAATPSALLTAVPPEMDPPPAVMLKVTGTFAIALPEPSLTRTAGATGRAEPTGAVWLFPA
jgi:hypothetical protein